MLRSSLVLLLPASAAQATSLAPRVCVHRARVVAMAAVTAAAVAVAAAAHHRIGQSAVRHLEASYDGGVVRRLEVSYDGGVA